MLTRRGATAQKSIEGPPPTYRETVYNAEGIDVDRGTFMSYGRILKTYGPADIDAILTSEFGARQERGRMAIACKSVCTVYNIYNIIYTTKLVQVAK